MIPENIIKEFLKEIKIVKGYEIVDFEGRKLIWIRFNKKTKVGLSYPNDESDLPNFLESINDTYAEEVLDFQDVHNFFSTYFSDWDSDSEYPFLSMQACRKIIENGEIITDEKLLKSLESKIGVELRPILSIKGGHLYYYYSQEYILVAQNYSPKLDAINLGNPFGYSMDTYELIYKIFNWACDETILSFVRSIVNTRNSIDRAINTLSPYSYCLFCNKSLRTEKKILAQDYYWEHLNNCQSRKNRKGRMYKFEIIVTDGEHIGNFSFIEQAGEVSAFFLRDESTHKWIKKFNMNISIKEAFNISISEIISAVPYKRI